MSADDKPKKIIRWRVRQGDLFGFVTRDFDSRGVIVLTPDVAKASSWTCEYHASLVVARTHEVQKWVRRSALADWPKFAPLMKVEALTYESFELTPAEAVELMNR